jgi:hypothetical protein
MIRRKGLTCETDYDGTLLPGQCADSGCPHGWDECAWPGGSDECPHFHHEPDIAVPITPEMVEAATLLDASGEQLLGHALSSALRGGRGQS